MKFNRNREEFCYNIQKINRGIMMFKRTISKCTEEVQGLVVKVWINENGTRRLTVTNEV